MEVVEVVEAVQVAEAAEAAGEGEVLNAKVEAELEDRAQTKAKDKAALECCR